MRFQAAAARQEVCMNLFLINMAAIVGAFFCLRYTVIGYRIEFRNPSVTRKRISVAGSMLFAIGETWLAAFFLADAVATDMTQLFSFDIGAQGNGASAEGLLATAVICGVAASSALAMIVRALCTRRPRQNLASGY